MIPLPQIISEFVIALGAALFGASVFSLIRPRRVEGSDEPIRPPARGKVLINAFIGLVVFVWGLASFLTQGAS